MSADDSGGYEYQFVDPGPTDDQKCPICHLVVRDAHQVTCCGKLLCETCLRMSQQHHGLCPLCRQNYCGNYFKDVRSDREIRTLKVFCGYKSLGCEWIGELRDIEDHISSCLHKGIKCPLCGVLEKSFLMDTHVKNTCPSRKYACPLCEEEGTHLAISTSHQNTCPEVVTQCPNKDCTVLMKRRKIPEHTNVCPKQRVLCSFASFGCDFHYCRELLAEHMKAEVLSHVELLGRKIETQISVFDNTVSQIALKVEKIENTLAHRSFTMKLTQFERHRQKNKIWYSNSFYTGKGGYKMRLIVYPNGTGNAVSTHVSVYINLMPGEHDDTLEFPVKANTNVSLLNQLEDSNHHTVYFDFSTVEDRVANRKFKVDETGLGMSQFIEYSSLFQSSNTCYLLNDSLYFRVEAHVTSQTKPWLTAV